MAENTRIEWTDATWNPVLGCTPVSAGCTNCFAAHLAATRLKHLPAYEGLAQVNSRGQGVFNGTIRLMEDRLLDPLKWRKPRRVFVNSMSDLFHPDVPFEFVDKVFAVMALCPQHTFQILTKRPERMVEYFATGDGEDGSRHGAVSGMAASLLERLSDSQANRLWVHRRFSWPLHNVWLGTSVENQETADERILHLFYIPAAVRYLSCEPLLGSVTLPPYALEGWHPDGSYQEDGTAFIPHFTQDGEDAGVEYISNKPDYPRIHWVIVGGESGPNARPMDLTWVYGIVRQCEAAGVPVFVKQLGKSFYHSGYNDGAELIHMDAKGADWDHVAFPDDLKIREFPEVTQ